jgi:hypothetical protein
VKEPRGHAAGEGFRDPLCRPRIER